MDFLIGRHLVVRIKYVFTRGGTTYWQRKVPKDLADRYPSSATLKRNLHTADPKAVAKKVAKLNREHEALWAAMRRDPTLGPQSSRAAALAVLKEHGLSPRGDNDDNALSLFYDELESRRMAYANLQPDPEEAYRFADPAEYLTGHQVDALGVLTHGDAFLLTDALDVYLGEHKKRGTAGFADLEEYARRAFDKLVRLIGDKVLAEVTRDDAKAFRDHMASGLKSASVRRYLGVVRAVFAAAIADKSLPVANVFHGLTVAGMGADVEKREPFTDAELEKLRRRCREQDDDVRWLLAIQIETGARLAEIAGLGTDDIHIDGEAVPYVSIRPRPWRSLKNTVSAREVPLVGIAHWAASRALAASAADRYLFPRYVRDGKCNAGAASATINKWLRASGLDHTTHALRHTMRDRLRNSGATRDIQNAVGGWGKSESADNYGKGYALRMQRDALLLAIPPSSSDLEES